jgi:hypothetical protein
MPAKRAAPPVKIPKRATPPDLVPKRVAHPTPSDHLAILSRAIFQAGLSWAFIESRWPAFLDAFEAFEVAKVAMYGEFEIERIMATDGVVHSRSKIEATIRNAKTIAALVAEFGSVEAYVRTFPTYDALYADAKKRFAYLGDLSCYYWLFRTGLPAPAFDDWIARQDKDHPRMREMVLAGRAAGTSSEVSA